VETCIENHWVCCNNAGVNETQRREKQRDKQGRVRERKSTVILQTEPHCIETWLTDGKIYNCHHKII
jgi:hypothetical protein